MDVLVLEWPEGETQRAEAAEAGVPRVLLVSAGHPPPLVADDLEDWVRAPADEADLEARVRTVLERALARRRVVPVLQDDVLSFGGRRVALAPLDARLVGALVGRYGAVVSRRAMFSAGWPEEPPNRNVLDVHLLRLRRRIAPLGLTVKTIRGRGYLLEPEPG
ncbi:MAG: winged helix-turn-helix domain-containing protein [Acidimicrobiia bacterium]